LPCLALSGTLIRPLSQLRPEPRHSRKGEEDSLARALPKSSWRGGSLGVFAGRSLAWQESAVGPQSLERAGAGGGWREALASIFGSLRSACNTKMGKGAAVVQDMSRRTYPKPPRKGKGGYKSDAPEPPYSFLDVPNCFVSATEGIRVSVPRSPKNFCGPCGLRGPPAIPARAPHSPRRRRG
jgi:hypothetical protein